MSEPMSERERWQLELDKLQRGLQLSLIHI
ncbi:hypothetical protein, partial [Pseudomonas aeruginosa]